MGFKQFARNVLSAPAPLTATSAAPAPSSSPRSRSYPHAPRSSALGYNRPDPEAQRVIHHYQSELAKIVALLEDRLAAFDRDPAEYAPTLEIRELRLRLSSALEVYFAAAGSRDTRPIAAVMDTVNRVDVRLRSLDDEVRAEVSRFESTAEDIATCIQPNLSASARSQYAADANDLLLELFLYRTSWQKAMQPDAMARLDTVETVLRSILESAPASSASTPLPMIRAVDDETLGDGTSSDSSGDGTYASLHRPHVQVLHHQPMRQGEIIGGDDAPHLRLGTQDLSSSRAQGRISSSHMSGPTFAPHSQLPYARSPSWHRGSTSNFSTAPDGTAQPYARKKRSRDLRIRRRPTKELSPVELAGHPQREAVDRAREEEQPSPKEISDESKAHVSIYPAQTSSSKGISCEVGGAGYVKRDEFSEEDVPPLPVMSRSRTLRDKVVLARTNSGREESAIEEGVATQLAERMFEEKPCDSGGDGVRQKQFSLEHEGSANRSFASILYRTQNARSEAFADTGMCFQAVSVRGDGRCLFRSVAQAREMVRGQSLMSERSERELADDLRARAVKELKRHRALLAQFYVIETDFAKYTKRMSNPRTFGGEPELLMLAKILHMPIAVYILANGRFKQIQVYGRQYRGDPCRILYRDGIHYDALRVVRRVQR